MVFYLGKPGIVPDSIIRQATQTMVRPAQFCGEENAKQYSPKLFLDQCTAYFILILEKLMQPIQQSLC